MRECDEPLLFCSNLLVTKKRDTAQLCILFHGRLLNNATVRIPTNTVTQVQIIAHFIGKIMWMADIAHAFFQIKLNESAQPDTAFYSEAHGKRYFFKDVFRDLKIYLFILNF